MHRRVGMLSSALAAACLAAGTGAVRAASGEALSPAAEDALRLIETGDAYERQVGFLRIEALREPASVEPLRAYITHKDEVRRAYALRALAAIQGAEAVPLLLEKLSHDKHGRVRRAAVLGLEPLVNASPEILPALIKALRDHRTDVRMAAVDVVSRIDHPQAREAIRMRNKREARRDVKRVLRVAMKRMHLEK